MKTCIALLAAVLIGLGCTAPALAETNAPAASAANSAEQPADPPTLDTTMKKGEGRLRQFTVRTQLAIWLFPVWTLAAGCTLIAFQQRRRVRAGLVAFALFAVGWLALRIGASATFSGIYGWRPDNEQIAIFLMGWILLALVALGLGWVLRPALAKPFRFIARHRLVVIAVAAVVVTALWIRAEILREVAAQQAECWRSAYWDAKDGHARQAEKSCPFAEPLERMTF